jgi:predicted O-methyltransferase YrrM
MFNRLKIAGRFLRFYFQAKTQYSVHSPFVYEFVREILEDDRTFYVFLEAEILRGELINSKEEIEVEDFGAGSHVNSNSRRKVSKIATSALSPDFQCQWLFRICQLYKPLTLIELGTSLGVSTLYITEGSGKKSQVKTLEGSPQIAALAQRNFDWFYETFELNSLRNHDPAVLDFEKYASFFNRNSNKNRIEIIEGNFDKTLVPTLKKLGKLDMAFIDGNHRYEPTVDYFEKCLPHIQHNSVLIFDDIHWSADMERAWETIKAHPSVKLTLDLFWCGIVFFRHENQEKEHFKLIKAQYKPFSWGFFK